MKIRSCRPTKAIPGGTVRIELADVSHPDAIRVLVGGVPMEILAASTRFVTIRLSEMSLDLGADVTLVVSDDKGDDIIEDFSLAQMIATELHPVSNPVVDKKGQVYVTYSGARGEDVPFGVYVVSPEGDKEPFLGDITNPTGLAIGPDDHLYISSRHAGVVYRSTFDRQVVKFAEGLGIASGMVFDSIGNLFVGDRSGFVYKVSPQGETSLFCELEPSVSAYHLSIDKEDSIYLAGPTLASQDSIYKISPNGEKEVIFKGFGRPQGVTFGPEGDLFVAASLRGKKGVYSLREGEARLRVAAPIMVGLVFGAGPTLYAADNHSLFRLQFS